MNNWQYTDLSLLFVMRSMDNGAVESRLASSLPEGTQIDPPPMPTFEQLSAQFLPLFSQWMEDEAKKNAYDSVLSCVSYENDEVHQFAGDALAMKRWRSALWKWASEWQSGLNGQIPNLIPTFEDLKAMAPQPEDFGWTIHPTDVIISAQLPPENPSA